MDGTNAAPRPPPFDLAQVLNKSNYIDFHVLEKAVKEAAEQKKPLDQYLLVNEVITEDLLSQAIAEYLKYPLTRLRSIPDHANLNLLTKQQATTHRAIVYKTSGTDVWIASDSPSAQLQQELDKLLAPKHVKLSYTPTSDLADALAAYNESLDTRFVRVLLKKQRVAPEFLDELFAEAYQLRASDIHFEPGESDVTIRLRIDGSLHEVAQINTSLYEVILNRIKLHANLRIDEHFATQDGALRISRDTVSADVRVSIVPTLSGEKIVLRILSSYVSRLSLADLGMTEHHQQLLMEAAHKPFGMVLVTGPTGSGKTTTLYALLQLLNSPGINITTIEDPVEYRIAGINQIQVNPVKNITFATGLRSIVRQDPNVILVGEIRDQDTTEIAINAALTGHLLLSTFHATDAATTIPRLLDIGAEPFLLSSTLELIISQRLARRICSQCRLSSPVNPEQVKSLPKHMQSLVPTTLYTGKGCQACNGLGYKGRIGIFELLPVDEALKEMIATHPSSATVREHMKKQQVPQMYEDAMAKVATGETTIEEVRRVVSG